MIHLRIHLLVLIALISCSCSTEDPSSHPKTGHYFPPRGYPEKSIVHLESFIDWNPEKLQDAAQAEMVILPIDWCFSPESEGILEELRQLNPGIQIIGYQVMLGVYTLWPDTSYLQATLPYKLDYYQAVTNEWASTTTGDTLMIWRDLILLNPIDGDEINRSLIDTMIDLIVEYQSQTGDALDGIMHDYFMYRPYINPTIRDLVEGEIDLNGNGVIIDEDTGEQALFYAWQKEYAREIRNRFGEDFIQVGNGRPPQEDAELAAILNGIFYENFPNLRWQLTDRDGLLRLLQHQEEGFLSTAKGRTWSILTNEYGGKNNLFCLVSSMLADCFYTEMHSPYLFTGWTIDIRAGAPQQSTILEGRIDSMLTVKRAFDLGEARISFFPSGQRNEVTFEESNTINH